MKLYVLLLICISTFLSPRLTAQENKATDWLFEYNWHWIDGQNIGSNLIVDIQEHNDTFFLLLPSQVLTSTDGQRWTEINSGYGQIIVRGLTKLHNKWYFVGGYVKDLRNRNGDIITKWKIIDHGRHWQVWNDLESEKTFMTYQNDTNELQGAVSHIHQIDTNLFLCVPLDNAENCFVYNYSTDTYYQIDFKVNTDEIEIEHVGKHVYILDDDRISFLYFSEEGKLLVCQTETASPEAQLSRFDDVIALRTFDDIQVLHDTLQESDVAAFKFLDVSRILRLRNKVFAISSSRGLSLLEPNGASELWTPPTVDPIVDGLLELEGQLYIVNWAGRPGLQVSQNGMFYSRYVGSSTFRFNNMDLIFSAYIDQENCTEVDRETFEFFFPELPFEEGIPKRLIHARTTNIIVESDSTMIVGRDKADILRIHAKSNGTVAIDTVFVNDSPGIVYRFQRLQESNEPTGYWVSKPDTLVFTDTEFNVTFSYPVPQTRSVSKMGDGYLIASYGDGLFYLENDTLKRVVYNDAKSNEYFSEVGFQNGCFFALSNEGIFLQDSAFAVSSILEEKPLYLYPVFADSKVEVNGGLFQPSLKTGPNTRIISTTLGVLQLTFPSKFRVNTQMLGGENPSDSVLAISEFNKIDIAGFNNFFAWNSNRKEWEELSSLELIQRNPSRVILAYSPSNNSMEYIEYFRKSSLLSPFTIYGIIVGLSIIILLLVRQQQRLAKSRKLQRLSLNSGWKPIKHNREDLHFKSIIQLIHHDFKGGMQMLLNTLSFAKRAEESKKGELIENAEGMILNFKQSLSDRLSNALYNDDHIYMDIESVIDSAMNEVREYALLKRIKLDVSSNVILKVKHSDELVRAVSICLGNAIKFSHNGQTVSLRTYITKAFLVIEILDNGIGLPNDMTDGIPEKQKGASGEVGMGVALGIVTKLLTKYDAHVSVENRNDDDGVIAQIAYPMSSTDYQARKNSKASDN
ncbi:sensor histidine kinase [Phaeocystidibacter luteus]|uniref:HAMP domain-containing histidine kinase n=1 Tax=Phaeocystidibacter luteus TaxID=911197 RepID=A0A6N6RHT8_9FLAO|nr:HAMP domain-containing sensor histidine kinase [Phaeocystidibacter luteus]KAB2813882.1 HAMP domain-containing histidine kinase [Phaeocystidibacter luteus]